MQWVIGENRDRLFVELHIVAAQSTICGEAWGLWPYVLCSPPFAFAGDGTGGGTRGL